MLERQGSTPCNQVGKTFAMTSLSRWLSGIVLALSIFGATAGHTQSKLRADVHCQPTTEPLQYDCEIKLLDARTNRPLSGVGLSVGADMPSMPGMHHVAPVKAADASAEGMYRARLVLEMHGDWALQLNISGPTRDRLVKMLRFEPDRVSEKSREERPTRNRR